MATSGRTAPYVRLGVRGALGVALAIAFLVVPARHGGAEAVDNAEFERRIDALASDPADQGARDSLAAVTDVDGRSVRLEPLVNGTPDEVAVRLAVLGSSTGASGEATVSPDVARAEAERILEDRDFQDKRVPAPFRRFLTWLGERLEPLGRPFGAVANNAAAQWIFTIAALASAAAAITVIARRRLRSPSERRRTAASAGYVAPLDPTNLEAEADAAECAGAHERALRLRFVAGLVRLEALDEVHGVEATPTNELRRELASADFDAIAADFDAIVYGERPATAEDSQRSREGWARIAAGHRR